MTANHYIYCIFTGICGQGSHVAGAHLVAGRPRGSACGWFGGVGGNNVENGRIWFFTFFHADRSGRELDLWLMITLSLIAIVYIGLIAITQTDMKKLIAYSSVSHMGFVTFGLYAV